MSVRDYDLPRPLRSPAKVGQLLEKLTALRDRIAAQQQLPPRSFYIVFSKGDLANLAAQQPRNDAEFREVRGVGPVKAVQYACFVDCIVRFLTAHQPPSLSDVELAVLLVTFKPEQLKKTRSPPNLAAFQTLVQKANGAGLQEQIFGCCVGFIAGFVGRYYKVDGADDLLLSVSDTCNDKLQPHGLDLFEARCELLAALAGDTEEGALESLGVAWALETRPKAREFYECCNLSQLLKSEAGIYPFSEIAETLTSSKPGDAEAATGPSGGPDEQNAEDTGTPAVDRMAAIRSECEYLSHVELAELIAHLMSRWIELSSR